MENCPFILDAGTGYTKIGWARDTFPAYSIPSLIGRPLMRYEEKIDEDIELKSLMIGDEAAKLRSYLELSYPISEGTIQNREDVESLWGYCFDKCNVNCSQTSILITEPVCAAWQNRKIMAEILFEKFGFDKMLIGVQALLSLFAEGLLTSTLLDSGDGVTHVIPVIDGYIQEFGIQRMNVAGRHITQYLIKLLQIKGYAFNSTADFELVREIKEKACFVSANIKQDRELNKKTTCYYQNFRLPDGSVIGIDRERFEAPELLFNPGLNGFPYESCSEIVFNAIQKCPVDCRKALYGTIMVSGGTTISPGFPTRLQNDVVNLYKEKINKVVKIKIKTIDPPRRKYNVFIGAGVYAKTFQNNPERWISKQDWSEYGENILKNVKGTL